MPQAPDAAEILNQALPYIQRFQGHTFVVKLGGSAMGDREAVRGVIRNVLLFQLVGIRAVLVHGGGPEIDALLERLGIESKTVGGLRATSDAAMEAVEMALAGKANKALVGEVHSCGSRAVGLSGRDGRTLVAEPVSAELGRAGRVVRTDPTLLELLCREGYVPIVCSVAEGPGGALNVNADAAAAAIAVALNAEKLVVLSDVDGVLADKARASSLVSRMGAEEARAMVADGRADKGMVPKIEAALVALAGGVESVHLLNARTPNSLLIEAFTDAGIGTMLVRG